MIAVTNNPRISPEEYFEWEAKQEIRYEYINGEVFAMAGGTIDHSASIDFECAIAAIYEDVEFLG